MAGCNSCGAPLQLDRDRGLLVCRHCGTEEQPAGSVGKLELLGASTHLCPTCAVPLSDSRLEGHQVLSCATCLGMLIEMNRFAAIVEVVRAHLYGGPGNIVIDTCERSLVNWLDAGELRRIAVAPNRQRSTQG